MLVWYGLQVLTQTKPSFEPSNPGALDFLLSMFSHSGPEHLLNNLFFISVFGTVFELSTSSKHFAICFLTGGILGNLSAFIFFPKSSVIGASAAAFGVMAALGFYKPRQTGIGLGVPMPMWSVLAVYILINFAGLTGQNSVAHEAHIVGGLGGAILGHMFKTNNDQNEAEKKDLHEGDWERRIREWERKYMKD